MHSNRGICRLCAKSFDVTSMSSVFSKNTSSSDSLGKLMSRYIPFRISFDDTLTHYVCKVCCANVIRWHKFLTMCIKAQAQLKNITGQSVQVSDIEVGKGSTGIPKAESDAPETSLKSQLLGESEQPDLNSEKKRKSNYCIARWCNNSNDKGLSLFRVPKDRNRALQWLSAADRMDLADRDTAALYRCYLCASHFTRDMFVNENCNSLNRNALPSVFPKPSYARKIEESLSDTDTYPTELQGVRLKSILPKTMQKSQEIPDRKVLPDVDTPPNYAHYPRFTPFQKVGERIQKVLYIPDSTRSQADILNSSRERKKSVQVLDIQGQEGMIVGPAQVLEIVVSGAKSKKYCKTSAGRRSCVKEEGDSNSLLYGHFKSGVDVQEIHETVAGIENKPSIPALPNNLSDSDAVMTIAKPGGLLVGENRSVATDSLDSFPNTSSFTSENSFLTLSDKNDISSCLENAVGSQDFLLMHSCSNQIEPASDTGFREQTSETPAVYGDQTMLTEASVRAIECTSPNHGQTIEGLIDFDQFLDSA